MDCGAFQVLSFGSVINDARYFKAGIIFPVGYSIQRSCPPKLSNNNGGCYSKKEDVVIQKRKMLFALRLLRRAPHLYLYLAMGASINQVVPPVRGLRCMLIDDQG